MREQGYWYRAAAAAVVVVRPRVDPKEVAQETAYPVEKATQKNVGEKMKRKNR